MSPPREARDPLEAAARALAVANGYDPDQVAMFGEKMARWETEVPPARAAIAAYLLARADRWPRPGVKPLECQVAEDLAAELARGSKPHDLPTLSELLEDARDGS